MRSKKGSRISEGIKDGGQFIQNEFSDDESKFHEPDLDDLYEDDDMEIYFTKKSLLAEIVKLEDDNLRKIELVQDDE